MSTRTRILDAAVDLSLSRGVGATSIDEIRAVAAVSKGGVFYHFSSKDALIAAAVEHFSQRLGGSVGSSVEDPTLGARARLFAFIDAVAESPALSRGCLLGQATMECARREDNAVIAETARRGLEDVRASMTALIAQAAEAQGANVDAAGLAELLLAAVEGGLLLDRHHHHTPSTHLVITQVRAYLELLLDPKEST